MYIIEQHTYKFYAPPELKSEADLKSYVNQVLEPVLDPELLRLMKDAKYLIHLDEYDYDAGGTVSVEINRVIRR